MGSWAPAKTHIAIKVNLLHFSGNPVRSVVFAVLLKCSLEHCFKRLFLYFTEFDGHFLMPKFG